MIQEKQQLHYRSLQLVAINEIKGITGEQYVRMREMRKNPTMVPVKCKILLASNSGFYMPNGAEDDPAFYKRLKVIPFIRTVPAEEIDTSMEENLQKEKASIVSKVV